MSQVTLRGTISRIGPRQIAILLLALATALVHLSLGVSMLSAAGHPPGPPPGHPAGPPPGGRPIGGSLLALLPLPLPVLFLINLCGYTILAASLYLPPL